MLTKSDLNQIQQVVQGELQPVGKDLEVLKDDLAQIRTKELPAIKADIKSVTDDVVQISTKELPAINKDIKSVKKDVVQIRTDVKTIVNFFDREYLDLRTRVERIEEHLHLPLPI